MPGERRTKLDEGAAAGWMRLVGRVESGDGDDCTSRTRRPWAALVSHAHWSPLDVITKSADIVIGQHSSLNAAEDR